MNSILLVPLLALVSATGSENTIVFENEVLPHVAATSGVGLGLRIVSPDTPIEKEAIHFFQRASGSLAMPVPVDITVTPEDNKVVYDISVSIPEVKNITTAFLRFDLAEKQKKILPVTIFPVQDMEATGRALNQKIEDSKWRLAVVNKKDENHIGDFLARRKVDFTTSDSLAANTLTLVDASAKEFKNMLPAADGARVLAFVETTDSLMPPRIHTTQAANGTVITTVTLPILDKIEANPRHREIFLNLLNQHLNRDITNL